MGRHDLSPQRPHYCAGTIRRAPLLAKYFHSPPRRFGFQFDRIAAYTRAVNPNWALASRAQVEEFRRRHRVGLVTLLFTDIIGSTQLKQTLGDPRAVALIQQHHSRLRAVLAGFPEGEEIDTAGDSFFIVFAKPSDAVKFSLLV